MKHVLLFFLVLPAVALPFAHHIDILSYNGKVLRLSIQSLYKPDWIRVILMTQTGVVFPEREASGVYEFRVEGSDYVLVSVQGFSKEYGPLSSSKPMYIDLKSLSFKPSVSVVSDIKKDGIYEYILITKEKKWKISRITLDNKDIKWFDWLGKALAVLKRDFSDGVHKLIVDYKLPYGLKKSFTFKLFSFKGILVLYRGKTYPYKIDYVKPYTYIVQPGETLWEIANRFNVRLGDLILINDIKNPDRVPSGTFLRIGRVVFEKSPTTIVINLFTARMGVYYEGKLLSVYPVALGRSDSTPPGNYWILRKVVNPTLYWYGEIIPPDTPLNGLGTRYLQLSKPQYAIHGTSKPWEIGKRISHGCIRMFNHDVENLDAFAPIGTNVIVIKKNERFPERLEGVFR